MSLELSVSKCVNRILTHLGLEFYSEGLYTYSPISLCGALAVVRLITGLLQSMAQSMFVNVNGYYYISY